jgi:NitT/TauT family transport system permease protein
MATEPSGEATSRLSRVLVPIVLGVLFLGLWEFLVHWLEVPKFVLPAPSQIFDSLLSDYATLAASMWKTLGITIAAFFVALALGITGAILFTQSRLFEISLFPYAVVLQVTPIVSIAPFILIWVGLDHTERALLILATIVAFFPILSNTTLGICSVV